MVVQVPVGEPFRMAPCSCAWSESTHTLWSGPASAMMPSVSQMVIWSDTGAQLPLLSELSVKSMRPAAMSAALAE